jgi:drug/metabolite transporter (DMT)-like permease
MEDKSMLRNIFSWNGWWICLVLGIGFMIIFILIGKAVKTLGVAATSIAYKLSFIIPTVVSILFYGDMLTAYKITGIIMAVTAVYFIAFEPKRRDTNENLSLENTIEKRTWLLPLIIFTGAGIIDAAFNFIQRNYTPQGFDHIVSITIFAGAFLSGVIVYGTRKEMYTWRNVAGGIVLGIPNYGSLYFLLQALKHTGLTPSTLFPINNLGIVCISAFAGILIFKEVFSTRKAIGFILAVTCIILIGFIK